MIGRVLSHYRIVENIGAGGMGVVYKADDLHLDRPVALKVLLPDKVADRDRRRRFIQEAKAASALNHPNIVTIHDIDESDGVHFIAMEYVEGRSLGESILPGGMPVAKVIEYAVRISSALAAAHGAGIIHRDLKPANIMVGSQGAVKVVDFGLAKLVELAPAEDAETRTASAQTAAGIIVGTVAYMSPEQASGRQVDFRTDVFSFGAVLYETLTGVRPFQRDSAASTLAAVLRDQPQPIDEIRSDVPTEVRRLVARCLEKDREARYRSAVDLHKDLLALQEKLGRRAIDFRTLVRSPKFLATAVVVLAMIVALAVWMGLGVRRSQWARNVALPEAARLSEAGKADEAFRLVREAARIIPDDPELRRIQGLCAAPAAITTSPPAADVFWKSYRTPNDAWERLGKSPLKGALVPRGYLRWKIVREGFEPAELAGPASLPVSVTLTPKGESPGMVRIPAGTFPFHPTFPVTLGEYWLDRREVTNREYKAFVDQRGYQKPEYWKQPFVEDGKTLGWEQAMARFRDATGRPGPATWEMSAFPEGQDEYPVGGVSWYEAAAYAEFVHKALPTIYHWRRAVSGANFEIISFSNFSERGPASAGSYAGLSPFGNLDMAGNVKEWCWNASGGRRYILGAGWNEPSYMFADLDARSPFARLPTFGFRCARYAGALPPGLLSDFALMTRDYHREKPVSDDVYRAYKNLYSYDRTDLNPVMETKDAKAPYWRREKVTLNAAYGGERFPVHLFLPRNVKPPYQVVVYFPGADAFFEKASSDAVSPDAGRGRTVYLIRSGRAVVYPIYNSTYERKKETFVRPAATSVAWRDVFVNCYRDLGRTLDYLETRSDIDKTRFAYYGVSVGGVIGSVFTALEPRFRSAVFVCGGLAFEPYAPEVDPLNFASRSRVPVLMLNGRYDFAFTLEGCQRPLYRLLGVPEKDKRHVVYDTGHDVPGNELVKEVLAWFDRYLGPVQVQP